MPSIVVSNKCINLTLESEAVSIMSKIECCKGVRGNTLFLQGILQNKIDTICEKIGFDDLGVLWTIYDPIFLYKNNIQHAILIGKNGRD